MAKRRLSMLELRWGVQSEEAEDPGRRLIGASGSGEPSVGQQLLLERGHRLDDLKQHTIKAASFMAQMLADMHVLKGGLGSE